MPWQREFAMICGEYELIEIPGLNRPIPVPAYRTCFDTTPRQSGKTLLKLCQYVHRALLWESFDGRAALMAYSAQSGSEARKKFKKEQDS